VTQPLKTLQDLINSLEMDLLQGQPILTVFDLDSTLFDVSPRIQRILDEMRSHPEVLELFPEHAPFLEQAKTERKDWGIRDAMIRAFRHNPPPVDFQRYAKDFWARHFFTNEYLHFDHLVEGSNTFVNRLYKAGSQVAYLTGRDWQRMGLGTVDVLNKWGFPIPNENNVKLAMKPVKGADDSEFKSSWFDSLPKSQFKRIVFFENEPVILHRVAEHHPHIELVFLDTTHSGQGQPADHWLTIENFKGI
jgi:hypothetical protein